MTREETVTKAQEELAASHARGRGWSMETNVLEEAALTFAELRQQGYAALIQHHASLDLGYVHERIEIEYELSCAPQQGTCPCGQC